MIDNMVNTLYPNNNLKVHYAGCDNMQRLKQLSALGVNYALYSAFPFIYRICFGKGVAKKDLDFVASVRKTMKGVIQDSGLFSLLYGKSSHLANEKNVFKWYDGLVEWTLAHGQDVVVVEVDCQDIISNEVAWDLRYRLRNDLPNNRIMNVWHVSDGMDGLDRLIEFSDYIAIAIGSGAPGDNSRQAMCQISKYIKDKKPEIDIHLLGCTHLKTMKLCRFDTSCDSTYWLNLLKFGAWADHKDWHISFLDTNKVKSYFGDTWDYIRTLVKSDEQANAVCMSVEFNKLRYEKTLGNQDHSKNFQY